MRAAKIIDDVVVSVEIVDDLPDGYILAEKVDGQPVAEKGWIRQPDGTFAPEAE